MIRSRIAPRSCSSRRGAFLFALAALLAALLVAPAEARAQRRDCSARHPLVDAVRFRGARVLPESELVAMIVTERASVWRRWFGWDTGPLTCLDSAVLREDAMRIADYYAVRGYPGSVVTSVVTSSSARRGTGRAQVLFSVQESAPVRIDSVVIEGLAANETVLAEPMRRLRGAVLDSVAVHAAADSVRSALLEAGYARALQPAVREPVVDTAARRAVLTFAVRPGRLTYVGPLTIRYTDTSRAPALAERDVRALLEFRPGDLLNARRLSASQRALHELGLHRAIRLERVETPASADTIPIVLHLTEGARRRARAGGGWGTLDCFRAQSRFVEQNLLGSGHRLELRGRVSKIGVADPFAELASLCAPQVRDDPFSRRLNYYVGAEVRLPGVFGARLRPALTIYSERRSEVGAYEQSTDIGGIVSLSRDVARRTTLTLQYQYEDGRTVADPATSCTRFGFCRVEDLASFTVSSPIHSVGASLVTNPLLPTDDPVSGSRWHVELRQGFTKIARTRTLNFTRLVAEAAAAYRPLGEAFVLAARAHFGFVFAPSDRSWLLPPQERFYSGGQSTVRGYDQNTLGPGSYIVDAYRPDTLSDGTVVGVAHGADGYRRIAPSGGNAIWLANVELRTRRGWPTELVRWVAFVDAGRVWNTNELFSVTNATPRVTPGVGLRLVTPLGPFRVDVGYNPNALESGPAFFAQAADAPLGAPGRAICVSPGTTDPLTLAPSASGVPFCPATFLPERRQGLFPRLAFQFSIGHAF